MKKKFIIANWKMNLSPSESLQKSKYLFQYLKKHPSKDSIILCPDYLSLPGVSLKIAKKLPCLFIGAQDCFYELTGPFTGEVSPQHLKQLGCSYCIVGHSERRIYLQESDELISKKIKQLFACGIVPILCIGEHAVLPEQKANAFLQKQLYSSLKGISFTSHSRILIAYEPVWAIGTGKTYNKSCDADVLRKRVAFLKKCIQKKFGTKSTKTVDYIYGGSVTAKTARSFIHKGGVNGLLVGTASLDQNEFLGIIKAH